MFLHSQTRYQRNSDGYTYVFGIQLSIGTHENTMRPNQKWKIPIWWPLNLKCMFLHSWTRYQRYSNGYTFVFGIRLSIGTHGNTWRRNRKWKNISRKSPENPAFRRGVTRARPAIEGIGGSRGGWGPIQLFLNHVKVSWWNEITIRLIRKLQSRTKD